MSITVQDVLEAYRDYTHRSATTRLHRQGAKVWNTSPIMTFRNFTLFNGRYMEEIPSVHRLPNVNPRLIDQLQMIWAWPHLNIVSRLDLIDRLEANLGRERQHLGPNPGVSRVITFYEDPADGTPPKAAP
jgi:hypothetical protein